MSKWFLFSILTLISLNAFAVGNGNGGGTLFERHEVGSREDQVGVRICLALKPRSNQELHNAIIAVQDAQTRIDQLVAKGGGNVSKVTLESMAKCDGTESVTLNPRSARGENLARKVISVLRLQGVVVSSEDLGFDI